MMRFAAQAAPTWRRPRSSSSTTTASSTRRAAPRAHRRADGGGERPGRAADPLGAPARPRRPPGGDPRRPRADADDPPRLDRPRVVHARRAARRRRVGRSSARRVVGLEHLLFEDERGSPRAPRSAPRSPATFAPGGTAGRCPSRRAGDLIDRASSVAPIDETASPSTRTRSLSLMHHLAGRTAPTASCLRHDR